MAFLKENIIFENWDSPIDVKLIESYGNHNLFGSLIRQIKELSPYKKQYDDIFIKVNKEFESNKNFAQEDIHQAYKKVHFFVNIQSNIAEILSTFKTLTKQLDSIIEIIEATYKIKVEESAKQQIQMLFIEKNKKLEDLKNEIYSKEKVSSIEAKFLQNQISSEEKLFDSKINFLTGQKLTNLMSSKIKSNELLCELKRKRNILESSTEYTEKLFKVIQENINGYKKVIDNLVFLYNANGGK